MREKDGKIILGIDPGSLFTGYAVLHIAGRKQRILEFGVLRFSSKSDHFLRLKQIHDRVTAVIDRTHPDECAVEMPVYGKSAQAMLKLGRAQAAAVIACLNREVAVSQYTPKEVKKSVTGNGNASKEQVAFMVGHLLKGAKTDEHDAADAIAVAICHSNRSGETGRKSSRNWADFVRENPGRIG